MKRAIIKINTSGKIEVFTSLRKLYNKFPEIEKFTENIDTYLTRRREDYVTKKYIIRRVLVNET